MQLALVHLLGDDGHSPVDPGFGRPGGGWGGPVDPGWGGGPRPPHVGGGPATPPGQRPSIDNGLPVGSAHPWLPGMIANVERPENGLPPVPDVPPPSTKPPPGTIWPPLPPTFPAGTHAVLVWVSGLGYRYAVITVPPPTAGTPLPPAAAPKA